MQTLQELIIEAVLALAIYLIGIRSLREVLHGALRRRWGSLAIQLLTFLMLLAVVAFFQIPTLAGFEVVAAVLAVLTVTSLTSLLQEYSRDDSRIGLWFEESAPSALNLMSRDREINTRGLMRIARALNTYGHTRTTSIRSTVTLKGQCQGAPYVNYEYVKNKETDIGPMGPKNVDYVITVVPSLRPPHLTSWDFPSMPLRQQGPEAKWRHEFWLPISCDHLEFWEAHIETIEARAQVYPSSGDSMSLQFEKRVLPRTVRVGAEEYRTKYVEFHARISLEPGKTFKWRFHLTNLIHPLDVLSMYFLAFDLCTGRWEFDVHMDSLHDWGIWSIVPIVSQSDILIPKREITSSNGHVTLQAETDSVILPQDAVLLMFRPSKLIDWQILQHDHGKNSTVEHDSQ